VLIKTEILVLMQDPNIEFLIAVFGALIASRA
jgi:hypothetical protein